MGKFCQFLTELPARHMSVFWFYRQYRIRPNYGTCSYKCTVKKFRSLQATTSALLSTSLKEHTLWVQTSTHNICFHKEIQQIISHKKHH